MMYRNLEEAITLIRSNLAEYLTMQNRNPRKPFQCPNGQAHSNGDRNPSAGVVKNNPELWNCFSCGEKGDIFKMAHYLEGFELKGRGFIEAIKALADRFNIELEEDEDAKEVIAALNYVASVTKKGACAPRVTEYLQSRDFTIADEFGIGYADPTKLFEILKKTYEPDFIERNQLARPIQFLNRITFPLHDESGEVVGFAGRTLTDDSRKYVNSSNSNVFNKSKYLYNLHRIKSKHVYVFEGYADVWRAYQNNIEAVACCGTSFTDDHLELLLRQNINDITFVFDGDDAGHKALERTLKLVEECTRARIAYISLSAIDQDPDYFIRTHGKDAFLQLKKTVIEEPIKKKKKLFANRLEIMEERFLNDEVGGYRSGFSIYDTNMENIQNGLHLVGGISNIGKTAWMTHLAIRLAQLNPDLFVLYASIDDDLISTVPRLVANLGSVPINQVKNPKKFIHDNPTYSQDQKNTQWARRQLGNKKLLNLAQNNLAVIDINDVSKMNEIEREVNTYQEITGKPVCLFLDNFHKVRMDGIKETRERFTHASEELKRITSQNGMITFATVELRKLGHDGRPCVEDIKESVDIGYDAQTIHLLHQDLHSKNGVTELKFMDGRLPGKDLPILEVAIAKNKISGYKGRIYYKFFTDFMYFEECDHYEQNKYKGIEV